MLKICRLGKSFDYIFFGFALHHIPNPLRALLEAKRVSGKLILNEPNGKNLLRTFDNRLGKILNKIWQPVFSPAERPLNPDKVVKWLTQAGWHVCERRFITNSDNSGKDSPLLAKVYRFCLRLGSLILPPSFGSTDFVIICEKSNKKDS